MEDLTVSQLQVVCSLQWRTRESASLRVCCLLCLARPYSLCWPPVCSLFVNSRTSFAPQPAHIQRVWHPALIPQEPQCGSPLSAHMYIRRTRYTLNLGSQSTSRSDTVLPSARIIKPPYNGCPTLAGSRGCAACKHDGSGGVLQWSGTTAVRIRPSCNKRQWAKYALI